MSAHLNTMQNLLRESEFTGDSYFGNPYNLAYEQYGMEHLDRNLSDKNATEIDEIESVAILGYN